MLVYPSLHAPPASPRERLLSRDYARSATKHSLAEAVAGCIESLRRYGFCVLDDVIPAGVVDEVRNATWCLARAKLSYSNL
jgi:hypothetical protein